MRLIDRIFSVRALVVAGIAASLSLPLGALACVDGAPKGEMVTIERQMDNTAAGQQGDFHVMGAGWFRATEIVKRGGSSDDTNVVIELDGEQVMAASFATLKQPWMQLNTPYIVANVRTSGDTSTMTIWYSPELKFRAILAVRVQVQEEGVKGVHMRAVMNKPGPHEDKPGQQQTASALPAFK
jgi:hypothetical protein